MQTINHLKQLKLRNMLIGIGKDEEELTPVLKIWEQEKSGGSFQKKILF